MSDSFDAYFKWLGIPVAEQPPHHYRLLGIQLYESDRDVINYASDRQMTHVRSFQLGKYANESQKILNEIAAARVCLLDDKAKTRYDQQLKERLEAAAAPQPPPTAGQAAPAPPPQPGQAPTADPSGNTALFRAYVDGALARLAGKIVSHDQEFEITEWGRKKYGLTSEAAFESLRDAAASSGKTLASLDRSKSLTPLRNQQPSWSEPQTQPGRPTSPAAQSADTYRGAGVSTATAPTSALPQIAPIVERPAGARPPGAAGSNRAVIIAVAVGGAVLLGAATVGIAIAAASFLLGGGSSAQIVQQPVQQPVQRPVQPPGPQNNRPPNGFQRPNPGIPPGMPGAGPGWWDGRMRVLAHRAINMLPASAELVKAAQSDDAQTRAAAYRSLIQLASDSQNPNAVRMIEPIITGGYALEPSESNATVIRDALLASIPKQGDPPPANRLECGKAFDMLGLLVGCSRFHAAPSHRVDQILSGTSARLDEKFTGSGRSQLNQFQQTMNEALAERFYDNLNGRIEQGKSALQNAHLAIAQETDRRLNAQRREALDLSFTLAALERRPSQWRYYDFLVQELCDSTNAPTVLQMVDAYLKVKDESLRQFMAERLTRRANVAGVSTPAEIAAAVRASLAGGPRPTTPSPAPNPSTSGRPVDPRWDNLSRTAGSALADVIATPSDAGKLLQETVNLAHAAALACAMSQGDEGRAAFDRLRAAGPPQLDAKTTVAPRAAVAAAPRPQVAASRTAYEAAARHVEVLNSETTNDKSKVNFLRSLADAARAGQIPELQGDTARALARFLLAPPSPDLNDQLMRSLPDFGRLHFVVLAMADEIDKTRTERTRVEQVLSAALARKVELPASGDWRAAAKSELLLAVVTRLTGETPQPASDPDVFADAIAALRDLYIEQASLLGVPPQQSSSKSTPAEILRLSIEHVAAELSGADLPAEDKQYLDQIGLLLDSIDFLSDNDLELTVMRQRVWSRVLAMYIAMQRPDAGPRAVALQRRMEAADRSATHVLLQLRDGQVRLVEMWLELNRPL